MTVKNLTRFFKNIFAASKQPSQRSNPTDQISDEDFAALLLVCLVFLAYVVFNRHRNLTMRRQEHDQRITSTASERADLDPPPPYTLVDPGNLSPTWGDPALNPEGSLPTPRNLSRILRDLPPTPRDIRTLQHTCG
ncbi:hypothetical protein EJ08DRAFT_4898 [Tothia fuscella]|uniref:Uncharacterized protein n=1 Tax=Tothia fuscella TaxID=1048955 RepID=A0A9P4P243_9PEZI|nr:hypothetical protein EJ08DRAFT_4898 [Tothia fuscella]